MGLHADLPRLPALLRGELASQPAADLLTLSRSSRGLPDSRSLVVAAQFYNAYNDYFTHLVGNFLDLRNDTTPVRNLTGDYFTETVTTEAARWVAASVTAKPNRSTFAYLAHQSNHGPLQVPQRYIDGECAAGIPVANPSRRIICGMMRAVDDSLANMTSLYRSLGAEVWERTVIIFSTDNGGPTDEGGSNAPLRGQKATSYEGGVRGVGWVGGGLPAIRRGAVSRAMIHVSDLYPTIVHGIAGLEVGVAADGTPPLDGVNAWPSILSASVASARTEMLLQLNAGSQAIRIGKYKLIKGMAGGPAAGPGAIGAMCTAHDNKTCTTPKCFPYNISLATAAATCHNGWVPAPESGKLPEPPPAVHCPALPCTFPNSTYSSLSEVLLFDVEADPSERNDLSKQEPAVLQELMARLQVFIDKGIPQDHGRKDPASNPQVTKRSFLAIYIQNQTFYQDTRPYKHRENSNMRPFSCRTSVGYGRRGSATQILCTVRSHQRHHRRRHHHRRHHRRHHRHRHLRRVAGTARSVTAT